MTQGIKYTVDIVLCIDATGSMSPIINSVKASALRFYEDLMRKLNEKDKTVDQLRVRVISFRDFYADGPNAMTASDFFTLPGELEAFRSVVNRIDADGGGDEPESGLEALAIAIQSPWSKTGDRRRQIIVLWTDASAHRLERAASLPSTYPTSMPKGFPDLTEMWEGQSYMNRSAKRLILYAPDAYAWTDIANAWENTLHFVSQAGAGLKDFDYQEILGQIAESV